MTAAERGRPGERPLAGVRVVDLSTSYSGPTAAMYLADMGASVLKVEALAGDDARAWGPPFHDGESAWFQSSNRNKISVALDLRTAEGQGELARLLEYADVLVESFNPSKLARLQLDPEAIRARYPRLIYCALSGYGLDGPHAHQPGYDLTAQARSGMMSVTGAKGGPPQRVSTAVCDIVAGIIAAFAVSAALVRQQATGAGELIDVSLLDAGLSLMAPRIASYLAGEPEPVPSGATDSVLAIYQLFETADRPIVVAVGNDAMWQRLCSALGTPHLGEDVGTHTNEGRRNARPRLVAAIAAELAKRPAVEWLKRFEAAGVPSAPVQSLSDVVNDEQVLARGLIQTLSNGFQVLGPPWRLAGDAPGRVHRAIGAVGEATAATLAEWADGTRKGHQAGVNSHDPAATRQRIAP